jgi:hypothetical protein
MGTSFEDLIGDLVELGVQRQIGMDVDAEARKIIGMAESEEEKKTLTQVWEDSAKTR